MVTKRQCRVCIGVGFVHETEFHECNSFWLYVWLKPIQLHSKSYCYSLDSGNIKQV